jgi:hypothetical protein
MQWIVDLHPAFEAELSGFPRAVTIEIAKYTRFLENYGPALGRPHADTLKGSKHPNMKELRFSAADGAWRIAFAFDPERKAILLTAGDKSGVSEKRFYKTLIQKADSRFDEHLTTLERSSGR